MSGQPLTRFHSVWTWVGLALAMIVLPLLWPQDFARSMFSAMGIAVIFALSYNMLLGQTGMLSFGHALYSGLGAYSTIHLLKAIGAGEFAFPVTLLPLLAGFVGAAFGVLLGYVSTKRAGTPFAMITLGLSELVASCALLLPWFFGGEIGVSGNRVTGPGWFGIDYSTQLQVYYLIAAWTFVCIAAMYAFAHTPLGTMCNAVRDNPERVRFLGYDTHQVRFRVQVVTSFFAGIAGGLAAINYEIVTPENVGVNASGLVMLMTVIGGVGQFYGPVLGAVLVTLMATALSQYTKAWMFYFGLVFLVVVLFAPGGFSSLIPPHRQVWRSGLMRRLLPSYGIAAAAGAVMLAGVILLVEMCYHLSQSGAPPTMSVFGIGLRPRTLLPWLVDGALLAAGLMSLRVATRIVGRAWGEVSRLVQEKATRASSVEAGRSQRRPNIPNNSSMVAK